MPTILPPERPAPTAPVALRPALPAYSCSTAQAREPGRMSTTMTDRWGVPVQGATPDGIAALDDAVECLLALAGDPVGQAEAAVAAAPDMALGQVYRAYLALYGTKEEGVAEAAKLLASLDADTSPGTRLQG